MVPSYSLVIWLPKTPKSHQSPVAPSSRKLWFSEDTQFWPKYSNSPGVAKSWQISKVTIRCHKRCLKLSWDQIWQKNSNGKCPKLPIRSAHSLRYIGGLSVNLNHLKNQALAYGQVKPPPPPDIGTLTYWHTRQESPQQPISPGTWWRTPVSPCAPRYQCAENRKIRYRWYTKK